MRRQAQGVSQPWQEAPSLSGDERQINFAFLSDAEKILVDITVQGFYRVRDLR